MEREFICSFFLLANRIFHKNRYLKEKILLVPLITQRAHFSILSQNICS